MSPTITLAELAAKLAFLDRHGKPNRARTRRFCRRHGIPLHPPGAGPRVKQVVFLSDLREHEVYQAILDSAHERKLATG